LTDKCVDVNMRVRLSEVTSFQQWNASTQHRHLSCRSWLNFFSFPVRMTRVIAFFVPNPSFNEMEAIWSLWSRK